MVRLWQEGGLNSDCNSTDLMHPFLGLHFGCRNQFCRKLENRRPLTFEQVIQQHHLPVRKFQRIMMRQRLLLVDLPEDGSRVRERFHFPPQPAESDAPYRSGEGKLSSRKNANCRVVILQSSKPCRTGIEVKWVASFVRLNLGRARLYRRAGCNRTC